MRTHGLRSSAPSGFTLIEILIALGLFGFLAAVTAFASLESYGRALAGDDAARIERALRKARADSQAGICREPPCTSGRTHAAIITPAAIVMREGAEGVSVERGEILLPLSGRLSFEPVTVTYLSGSGNADSLQELTASTTGGTWQVEATENGLIDAGFRHR